MASRDPTQAGRRYAVRLEKEGWSLYGGVLPGLLDAIRRPAIQENHGGFIRTVTHLGRRHNGRIGYDTS